MPPQDVEFEFNTFSLPSGAHMGGTRTYQSKNLERKCHHQSSQNFILIPINEPPPLQVLLLRSDEEFQEQSCRKKRGNNCICAGTAGCKPVLLHHGICFVSDVAAELHSTLFRKVDVLQHFVFSSNLWGSTESPSTKP